MIKWKLLKFLFAWNFYNEIVFRVHSNVFCTAKLDCVIKTREIFSFLFLKNNSVPIGLTFLLLSISAIIWSKTVNILRLLFGLYCSVFLWISSISFEYSIKTLELFKCLKSILSGFLIKTLYLSSYRSLAFQ